MSRTLTNFSEIHVSVFVDWKNALFFAKRMYSSRESARTTTDVAEYTLLLLREAVLGVPLPQKAQVFLETLVFAGFTDPSGKPTSEYLQLTEATARLRWSGRVNNFYRFLPVRLIDQLPSFGGAGIQPLSGLYRPTVPLRDIFVSDGDTHNCDWARLTLEWINHHDRGKRVCPKCAKEGELVPFIIAKSEQKLVDTLLGCWALQRAYAYTDLPEDSTGEIWIVSSDADFVPVLATVRSWGVGSVWLQPFPNRKHGYSDRLTRLGVRIASFNDLLGGRDGKD